MYRSDSHTHTTYSADVPDDRPATPADMCAAAYKMGLSYFAITDHYDISPYIDGFRQKFAFAQWQKELLLEREKYAGKMYVAVGLEYGEPYLFPAGIDETLSYAPFDVVLGSVHYVPGTTGYLTFPFHECTEDERRRVFDDYLDAWEQLVHTPGIDVFTHPTYPLRYCLRKGVPFSMRDWEERMRMFLAHIVSRGCGLEFNAAPYRVPDKGIPDHTTETVLRWYKEAGGEILTFASDAHFQKDIAAHHDFALRVAREIGFRYIAVYKEHKPEFHRI